MRFRLFRLFSGVCVIDGRFLTIRVRPVSECRKLRNVRICPLTPWSIVAMVTGRKIAGRPWFTGGSRASCGTSSGAVGLETMRPFARTRLPNLSASCPTQYLTRSRDNDRGVCVVTGVGHIIHLVYDCSRRQKDVTELTRHNQGKWDAPEGATFKLILLLSTLLSLEGSRLCEASSASSSSFCRSLIVS